MNTIRPITSEVKQISDKSKKKIAASLALALCTLWPGATLSVQQDPGTSAPRQAVVFDGSLNSDSTFGVAFTADGIIGQVSSPVLTCSGESAPPERSTMHLSPERVGVFTPISEPVVDAALDPSVSWPDVSAAPRFLHDCDAAGQFYVLSNYLDAAVAQAENLIEDVERCTIEVEQEACILSDLINQILTRDESNLPGRDERFCFSNGFDNFSRIGRIAGPECQECSDGVMEMPSRLNDLHRARANCSRNERQLKDLIAHYTLVRERGERIPNDEKSCVLMSASEVRAETQRRLTAVERLRREIDSVGDSCEYEVLTRNCPDCALGLVLYEERPRRPVIIERGYKHMGRLVGAFQSAAGQSHNEPTRERFRDLAQRLADAPRDRVLHITAPSGSSVSQLYVAVSPSAKIDDGQSPLLVVLTLLSQDAKLPEMTLEDKQALSDAFRVFASTLKPVCTPDAVCK